MIGWSVAVGAGFALVLAPLSHRAAAGVHRATRASCTRPRSCGRSSRLMQPLGGAVFALDGILIGAGDTRYLMWSMLAASALFIVAGVACVRARLGIVGVWAALDVLLLARLALLGPRFVAPTLGGRRLGLN